MASVKKRIHKTKDGKERAAWTVRYVHEGAAKQSTFKTKREADTFRDALHAHKFKMRIEGRHAAPVATAIRPKNIAELCEEFIRVQEGRVADGRIGKSRLRIMKVTIDRNIIPHLGKKLVRELTVSDVDAFHTTLQREDYAPKTARDRVYLLKQICDLAVRREYIAREIVSEALGDLKGFTTHKIRTFTREEVQHLLTCAKVRRPRCKTRPHAFLQCAVHLAAFCGLRYGEITGLTLANVDLQSRTVKVRHSLTADDELKEPKTRAGRRDVPIPEHLIHMLNHWSQMFYVENPRGLFFTSPNGNGFNGADFHFNPWKPLLDQSGLRNPEHELHFHALRHFAASWLVENRVPFIDVKDIMGHASINTTLSIYAHSTGASDRQRIIDKMADDVLKITVSKPQLRTPVEILTLDRVQYAHDGAN